MWPHNTKRKLGKTAAKPKMIRKVKDQLQRDYLANISVLQQSSKAPSELIINIDQMPIKIIPLSDYTTSEIGRLAVSVIVKDDRKVFTAVLSEMSGTFLPM